MPTPTPPYTPLPTPVPSRADRTNFAARADAFLAALPTFQADADAIADAAYANALEAEADATAAAASNAAAAAQVALAQAQAQAAADSAAAAASAAGAALWNAPTNYATGAVVYSPVTGLIYRRIAPGGVDATDPSAAPGKWLLISVDPVLAQLALINQGVF